MIKVKEGKKDTALQIKNGNHIFGMSDFPI